MRLHINGEEYNLKFGHLRAPSEVKNTKKHRVFSQELEGVCKGMTLASISRDGEVLAEGRTLCSWMDTWNYQTGRKIALSRALANLPREFRKQVWERYFEVAG